MSWFGVVNVSHGGLRGRRFHAAISNGLSLHGVEWGRANIPCILIHGSGDSAYIWEDFATRIPSPYRAIAIDLRGHGDSDWDHAARYDAETMAGDLAEAVESLNLGRVVVVGHSLGGEVALHYSVMQPANVLGLVLVDFGPELNPAGRNHICEELGSTPRAYRTIEDYLARLIERHPLAPHHVLNRLAAKSLRNAGGGFEIKYDPAAVAEADNGDDEGSRQRQSERELWKLLARVKCPTLVVRGAGSSVLPREVAERMAHQVLRDGRLAVVEVAGHCVMIDNPEGFHKAVTNSLLNEGVRC